MSCEYCEHRSIAYRHYRDDNGRDKYERVAEPIPYDDDMQFDPEPMLSWPEPGEVEWADRKPRLCVGAYDMDGEEVCISIKVNYCPMCDEKLPLGVVG